MIVTADRVSNTDFLVTSLLMSFPCILPCIFSTLLGGTKIQGKDASEGNIDAYKRPEMVCHHEGHLNYPISVLRWPGGDMNKDMRSQHILLEISL